MNNWSVIRTRSRWEKKVAQRLLQKGVETFCPLQKAKHQWSDRVKIIETPLLKSYVFVKVTKEQRTIVRLTEGVVNFVYRSGKPVVVKEKTIQDLRRFQLVYPNVDVAEVLVPVENGSDPVIASSEKHKQATLWLESLNFLLISRSA